MVEEYYVKPCEFTCARSFLSALDETNSEYRGETWIFRGQDVDKDLMPSAMRSCTVIDNFVNEWRDQSLQETISDPQRSEMIDKLFRERFNHFTEHKYHSKLIERIISRYGNSLSEAEIEARIESITHKNFRENFVSSVLHGVVERNLVVAFVGLADEVGLKVPQDSFSTSWNRPFPFRDQLRDAMLRNDSVGQDEVDECASIAYALARHHRVPTRLLDCTYRPLVAAFFAADSDCDKDNDPERRIIVWAIHEQSLPEDIQVVKHRRSEIGFLQAQDGLFIYDKRADDKYWFLGEWAPIDYYLHDLAMQKNAYKFTLPFSKRGELLDLLELRGIRRPMLMPAYDYVSREIQKEGFDLMDYVVNKV